MTWATAMDVEQAFGVWCKEELVKVRLRDVLDEGKTHEWLQEDWLMELLEEAFVNGWLSRRAVE